MPLSVRSPAGPSNANASDGRRPRQTKTSSAMTSRTPPLRSARKRCKSSRSMSDGGVDDSGFTLM